MYHLVLGSTTKDCNTSHIKLYKSQPMTKQYTLIWYLLYIQLRNYIFEVLTTSKMRQSFAYHCIPTRTAQLNIIESFLIVSNDPNEMNMNGLKSEMYQFTRFSSIFTRFRSFFVSNVGNAISINGLRLMELKKLFTPSFPRQSSAELFETFL